MSFESTEEIAYLENLRRVYQRRLRVLEQQIALYGAATAPAHLVLDAEDTRHDYERVQRELRRLQRTPSSDQPPYLGLMTFQEEDADLFFGREALLANLVDRLSRSPFLAILGPSGSGKSSLVRAGVIPMLKAGALPGSETWRYVIIKPGSRPLDALAVGLASLVDTQLPSAVALGDVLRSNESGLLQAGYVLLKSNARLVLVVDQFEELWFQAHVAEQRQLFIQQLLAVLAVSDAPILIIFTMRADFLVYATEDPALARAIGDHLVLVSQLTANELNDAIVRPAEQAGCTFQPGLVDELIMQTREQPGALPLLQYTLSELWKGREGDGTMTWAAYRALGGIEGALQFRADEVLTSFYTPAQQSDLRLILLRLVRLGEGFSDTRRRVPLGDLVRADQSTADVQALLVPLIDARLLTTSQDGLTGEVTVEFSHESLVVSWRTMRYWIEEARTDLRFQLQLEEAAHEWQDSDARSEFLWTGLRLANAESWIKRAEPLLSERERTFLAASLREEQANIASREASRQRELEQARQLALEQAKSAGLANRRLSQVALLSGSWIALAGFSVLLLFSTGYLAINTPFGSILTSIILLLLGIPLWFSVIRAIYPWLQRVLEGGRRGGVQTTLASNSLGADAIDTESFVNVLNAMDSPPFDQSRFNPYIVGDPIREEGNFYGRSRELSSILDSMAANHALIYGDRRIGKTSLLYQLRRRLVARSEADEGYYFIPLYFSLQAVSEQRFFKVLFERITRATEIDLQTLVLKVRGDGYDNLDAEADLERIAAELNEHYKPKEPRIVLLLDEMDIFDTYSNATHEQFRALLQIPAGQILKIVAAGVAISRTGKQRTSPWYNLFGREIELHGLDAKDVYLLIVEPVRSRFTWDEAAITAVREFSNHKPRDVQALCSLAIERMYDAGRRAITSSCVMAALGTFARERSEEYREAWRGLEQRQRDALRAALIAKGQIVPEIYSGDNPPFDRARLYQFTYEDSGGLQLSYMFRRWMEQQL